MGSVGINLGLWGGGPAYREKVGSGWGCFRKLELEFVCWSNRRNFTRVPSMSWGGGEKISSLVFGLLLLLLLLLPFIQREGGREGSGNSRNAVCRENRIR